MEREQMSEMDLSKLTLEIFSKLEQKWLSDPWGSPPSKNQRHHNGSGSSKTRILSVDGGLGPGGLVAAQALIHLETLLQTHSNNPSARIAQYFDLIAGTGLGGVLAALLTVSDEPSSKTPLFSAAEAVELLMSKLPQLFRPTSTLFRRSSNRRFSGKTFESVMRSVFKSLSLKDTCRPLLVPCYDLNSSAPFVFSRADASGSPSFDFQLWEVCRATSATPGLFRPFGLTSVDRKTTCVALDGGVVMNNPTAAAITHVLHNKREFPGVNGVEDLLVLSVGNGKTSRGGASSGDCSSKDVMEIVMRGVSDTVDQMLANAFCWSPKDYVRIQANGLVMEAGARETTTETTSTEGLRRAGERMLGEKGVESLPFGGKRLLTETNGERVETFVRRLMASNVVNAAVEPLLLLAPASPPREDDGVTQLADGR